MAQGKRTRKKQSLMAIARTTVNKENRIARTKKYGHCKSRKYGTNLHVPERDDSKRLYSFEDEYKTYRRTRGRRGLAPNPDVRQDENLKIRLFKTLATYCGTFPIGELMEHPIGRS